MSENDRNSIDIKKIKRYLEYNTDFQRENGENWAILGDFSIFWLFFVEV